MSLVKQVWSAIVTTIQTHKAPKKYAEPIRVITNKVIAAMASITALLAVVNTNIDFVPAKYRDQVTGALAVLGAACIFVTKWASELMRSKVFSPATVDQAVKVARRKPADAVAPQVDIATVANVPPPPVGQVTSTDPHYLLDELPPPPPPAAPMTDEEIDAFWKAQA